LPAYIYPTPSDSAAADQHLESVSASDAVVPVLGRHPVEVTAVGVVSETVRFGAELAEDE
jgi:hypothetical protein